jgi:hypothetical protein
VIAYPHIKIAARIASATTVKIVPTAAVELSKKLSDILLHLNLHFKNRIFYWLSSVFSNGFYLVTKK